MRDLTKALGRFSVAMSCLGAQQALNFVRRPIPDGGHPSTRNIEALADAAEGQLNAVLEGACQAGDRVQAGAVDLAFSFVSPQALNPERWGKLLADTLRQPGAIIQQFVRGRAAGSSGPAGGQPCGWGPMPRS